MKKIMNTFNMAIISAMVTIPAFADVDESAICKLVGELGSVFRMLRTFAFIGAAFMIAGWAWGYITSGKVGDKDGALGELKSKGTALLIGSILLFTIGLILDFLVGAGNGSLVCPNLSSAFK